MATKTMTVLAFELLLQYASCYAQIDQVTLQGQRPSRFGGGECWIERLDMLELSRQIEAEAGVSKLWDENEDQLQCAGVAVVRHIIRQRVLFLPAFTNAPELLYVVQGKINSIFSVGTIQKTACMQHRAWFYRFIFTLIVRACDHFIICWTNL